MAHNCLIRSMCLCESECTRGGGAHSCMLLCCQLAECRPWSRCCCMTCTYTGMTKIPLVRITPFFVHPLISIVNNSSFVHTSHLFHYSHSADLCPDIFLSYSIALLFGTLIHSPICMLRLEGLKWDKKNAFNKLSNRAICFSMCNWEHVGMLAGSPCSHLLWMNLKRSIIFFLVSRSTNCLYWWCHSNRMYKNVSGPSHVWLYVSSSSLIYFPDIEQFWCVRWQLGFDLWGYVRCFLGS